VAFAGKSSSSDRHPQA